MKRLGALDARLRGSFRALGLLARSYTRPHRRPGAASLGSVAVVVLASGILIGVGIGPLALGASSAARRLVVLVTGGQPPARDAARTAPGSPSTGGGLAPPAGQADLGGPAAPAPGPAAPVPAPGGTAAPSSPPSETTTTTPAPPPPTTTTTPPPGPTGPVTTPLDGRVAHVNPHNGAFALAATGGDLRSVHGAPAPTTGQPLLLDGRHLLDGTFAVDEPVPAAPADRAPLPLRGTVTFVDPVGSFYVLSAPGVSLAIGVGETPPPSAAAPASLVAHRALAQALGRASTPDPGRASTPDPGRASTLNPGRASTPGPGLVTPPLPVAPMPPHAPPAAPLPSPPDAPPSTPALPLPALGDRVRIAAESVARAGRNAPAWLRETARESDGIARGNLDVAGVVLALDARIHALVLSGDDAHETTAFLPVVVPEDLSLMGVKKGVSVVAHLRRETDGTFTLTGLAADTGADAADDPAGARGDFSPFAAAAAALRAAFSAEPGRSPSTRGARARSGSRRPRAARSRALPRRSGRSSRPRRG